MENYFGDTQLVRLVFQRSLAAVYFIAFLVAFNQFPALLGEKGLLPVPEFIRYVPFKISPSVFYLGYSDWFFTVVVSIGLVLSSVLLLGLTERGSWWMSTGTWMVVWILYLSIVNVGQTFYGFGWESMLCEAGFFCAFLGSSRVAPSIIPILILRWMLFRTEFGAGLIKLHGDACWRDLTCLFYHYETQPMPNPLSWNFHYLPGFIHVLGVLFSQFVQIVVPFGLFGPQKIAAISGGLIIFHQLLLIISGNYSFLNWLTVVLGITALSDSILRPFFPFSAATVTARSVFYNGILYALAALTLVLSIPPTLNFFKRNMFMNYSYNPLHLVNSYGAFGSITKIRYELVVEGTEETMITPKTNWREYEFKGKPGDVMRRPPQIAPYHLRLDWLMWFIPFSVEVSGRGVFPRGYDRWFLRFLEKLLEADAKTLKLLGRDPFLGHAPHFIRVRFYRYEYTNGQERQKTGAWWKRSLIGEYLPQVDLRRLRNL